MFTIGDLSKGAVGAEIEDALQRIFEDIVDPNKSREAVRSVSINLSIKPDKKRQDADVKVTVVPKLAPPPSVETRVVFGMTRNGVEAEEMQRNLPEYYENEEQPTPLREVSGDGGEA
ncbi:MAG: hypothetical protein GY906_11495 [bacterium]|nr:hypothetical protein [bacterium]